MLYLWKTVVFCLVPTNLNRIGSTFTKVICKRSMLTTDCFVKIFLFNDKKLSFPQNWTSRYEWIGILTTPNLLTSTIHQLWLTLYYILDKQRGWFLHSYIITNLVFSFKQNNSSKRLFWFMYCSCLFAQSKI